MRSRRRKSRGMLEPRNLLAGLIFVLIFLVLSMFYMRALRGRHDHEPQLPGTGGVRQRQHGVARTLNPDLSRVRIQQSRYPEVQEALGTDTQQQHGTQKQEQQRVQPMLQSPDELAPGKKAKGSGVGVLR